MPVNIPTMLYRLFNADGDLLYIGISGNLKSRLGQHILDKPWWPEVEDMTTEMHPSWDVAKRAETKAIAAERPRYNLAEVDPELRWEWPNLPVSLPDWASEERPSLLRQISVVINDSSIPHAQARLLCLSILLTGDTQLPRGAALAKLARQCGVSLSEAYKVLRIESVA